MDCRVFTQSLKVSPSEMTPEWNFPADATQEAILVNLITSGTNQSATPSEWTKREDQHGLWDIPVMRHKPHKETSDRQIQNESGSVESLTCNLQKWPDHIQIKDWESGSCFRYQRGMTTRYNDSKLGIFRRTYKERCRDELLHLPWGLTIRQ